jgi:hypothetical protein
MGGTKVFSIGFKGQMAIVPTAARTANTDAVDHYHRYDVLCNSQPDVRRKL